jgi:hypothetical protein
VRSLIRNGGGVSAELLLRRRHGSLRLTAGLGQSTDGKSPRPELVRTWLGRSRSSKCETLRMQIAGLCRAQRSA